MRRYRTVSARSWEELAERARVSRHAVSDLERGARHAPHFETVRLLVKALVLGEVTTWRTESTLLLSAQVNGKRRATLGGHEATQWTVAI